MGQGAGPAHPAALSFRKTLERHLDAIRHEIGDMGVALLHLDYGEDDAGKPPVRSRSYPTLVFQNRAGKWLMVQDQNTPIR